MGFSATARAVVLFVVTTGSVTSYQFRLSSGDIETNLLDENGGALGCAAMSGDGQTMLVARSDVRALCRLPVRCFVYACLLT